MITKEEVEATRASIMTRADLAAKLGLEDLSHVRCLNCKSWGWNCGKTMNSMGESICIHRKWPDRRTASYQWCKKFENYR